jgi:hypothetical protein
MAHVTRRLSSAVAVGSMPTRRRLSTRSGVSAAWRAPHLPESEYSARAQRNPHLLAQDCEDLYKAIYDLTPHGGVKPRMCNYHGDVPAYGGERSVQRAELSQRIKYYREDRLRSSDYAGRDIG